jgi:hypothetical protein
MLCETAAFWRNQRNSPVAEVLRRDYNALLRYVAGGPLVIDRIDIDTYEPLLGSHWQVVSLVRRISEWQEWALDREIWPSTDFTAVERLQREYTPLVEETRERHERLLALYATMPMRPYLPRLNEMGRRLAQMRDRHALPRYSAETHQALGAAVDYFEAFRSQAETGESTPESRERFGRNPTIRLCQAIQRMEACLACPSLSDEDRAALRQNVRFLREWSVDAGMLPHQYRDPNGDLSNVDAHIEFLRHPPRDALYLDDPPPPPVSFVPLRVPPLPGLPRIPFLLIPRHLLPSVPIAQADPVDVSEAVALGDLEPPSRLPAAGPDRPDSPFHPPGGRRGQGVA